MTRRQRFCSSKGYTMVELMVAVAVAMVVTALLTTAFIGLARDQALRQKITTMQGDARAALTWMEQDMRQASLNSGTGVIWTDVGGSAVSRPSVQIFANVPGGGFLDVKPGTGALLVVEGLNSTRAATVGTITTSALGIPVTTVAGFAVGQPVLFGDFGDASWGVLSPGGASGNTLSLSTTTNLVPGQQVKGLAAGASVRAARSRLYYVDTADELVRVTLNVPRAPSSPNDLTAREVLAVGIENMQVTCQMDNGTGQFQACPTALATTDPIAQESMAAFGVFQAGQGPLLPAASASLLRTMTAIVGARSRLPVDGRGQGDLKIPIAGVSLPVGGASDTANYARRAYQISAAVRNTSLGVF